MFVQLTHLTNDFPLQKMIILTVKINHITRRVDKIDHRTIEIGTNTGKGVPKSLMTEMKYSQILGFFFQTSWIVLMAVCY